MKNFIVTSWRNILLVAAALAAICRLLLYRLGNLTPGVSTTELNTKQSFASLHAILHNPLDAPYKLIGWALLHLPIHGAVGLRLPSVVFGIMTLIIFIFIVRRWYGFRTALFGVVLFVTSSWLLHVSRYSSIEAEYLWGITTLIGLHLLLHVFTERVVTRLLWAIGMVLLLFIPGFVWLVLFNVVIQREDIAEAWSESAGFEKIIYSSVFGAGLVLLALTFYFHSSLLMRWIGAPTDMHDWQGMLKRFGNAFAYFVVRGPDMPGLWLGRLPVLDAFMTAMLVAGLAFYARHLSAPRTQLLCGLFLISAVLFAFNSSIKFSALVPLVYLIAIAGIASILHTWLKVFPRNPIARGIGIGIIALVTVVACVYQLRSYFIAWPGDTITQQVMHHDAPKA